MGAAPKYFAKCDYCGQEIIEPLHEAIEMAALVLIEKYGWFLLEDFETCYCSEECIDKADIEGIDTRIKEYHDGDERRTIN